MITIRDIAREAHVSVATVSRVLNNPEIVNEERRQRVLKVIQQYLVLLLSEPGSDTFHPEWGGGLREVTRLPLDPKNPSSYTGPVMAAVERARAKQAAKAESDTEAGS